jgi:hypothetical protein
VALILEAMAFEGRTMNPQLVARILNLLRTFKP